MQKTEGDMTAVLAAITRLESEMRALRRDVSQLVLHADRPAARKSRSLRGIFPSSDIDWQDFREVRASWIRERKP